MVIIRIRGGLGNQLQQYAMYRKFKELSVDSRVDVSWFTSENQEKQYMPRKLELRYFENLDLNVCTDEEKERLIGKENSIVEKLKKHLFPSKSHYFYENGRMYLPEVFTKQNVYLDGYWACESYYHDILPILQKEIIFPKSQNIKNENCIKQMETENAVSLHIRRGDYLNPENAALFGNICTEDYYKKAIQYIRERVEQPHFYIFSDDPVYAAMTYTSEEFTIVDWNQAEESFFDIQLMSKCKHNICANSTFSFWGARLNEHTDKIMIRPLKHRNNQQYDVAQMKELWPDYTLIS